MKNISVRWTKVVLWLTSYLELLLYVLTGGYVALKSDNQELNKENKKVFIVTLIFVAIRLILQFLSLCFNFGDRSINSYDFYQVITNIVNLSHLIVIIVFSFIAIFSREN